MSSTEFGRSGRSARSWLERAVRQPSWYTCQRSTQLPRHAICQRDYRDWGECYSEFDYRVGGDVAVAETSVICVRRGGPSKICENCFDLFGVILLFQQ